MLNQERKNFKAVVFDLDGVIINSEPIHMDIINDIVSPYGEPLGYTEYYRDYVGRGEYECCSLLKEKYGIPNTVEDIIRMYKDAISVYFDEVEELPVLPGVAELVKNIYRSGLKLAVASSSSNRNIRLSLRHAGLESYFDVTISAEDVENGKPAPDVYLRACDTLGIMPGQGIAIEDSAAGVKAAKSAGLFTVGFINPDSGNQDLSGADMEIRSFEEIGSLL